MLEAEPSIHPEEDMTTITNKVLLGTYVGIPDSNNISAEATVTQQYDSFVNAMGQPAGVMDTYVYDALPESLWVQDAQSEAVSWAAAPWATSLIPDIGIPMASVGENADQSFQNIINGSEDSIFKGIFQAWTGAGYTQFYIRPGFEMNGTWMPWSVTPANVADFVAAFQHIAALAHAFTGANIQVVFNPNAGSTSVPLGNLYPGNAGVDIVGLDTYGAPVDSGDSPGNTSTDSSTITLLDTLALAKANGKQFAIPETGGLDPTFATALGDTIAQSSASVAFVNIWDVDGAGSNLSWSNASDDQAATAAAWKEAFQTILAHNDASPINTPTVCFVAGTAILTERGEVPVEKLTTADMVMTLSNGARAVRWIGRSNVLATRGRRSAATPVIVRKGALADNIPNRDLHVTKAHSLYVDDVLIPVEFLVNHRTILWDDWAQEVEIYHVELDSHDVLFANGAPAESFRDDGNRWLFQNARSGLDLPAQGSCAPVLTGGPIVDAAWRRLLDRAGPRDLPPLTDNPDLHLVVDGERVEPMEQQGQSFVFRLARCPTSIHIASREGVPAEVGLVRDPRSLGVAFRRIVVRGSAKAVALTADDERLTDGFHGYEPANDLRWTNGYAGLPAALFAPFEAGAIEVVLTLGGATRYPDFGEPLESAAA